MPRQRPDESGLTEQQRLFCWHYINGKEPLNGAAAARAAGYSKKSAKVTASRLLDEPPIRLELERLRGELMGRLDISRDRVLEEFRRIGFAKFTDVAEWDEDTLKLKPSEYMPEDVAATIEGIEATVDETLIDLEDGKGEKLAINRRTRIKIRQHSKLTALRKLLEVTSPARPERGGAGGGNNNGVQIIVSGGPTGLETSGGGTATITVGGDE